MDNYEKALKVDQALNSAIAAELNAKTRIALREFSAKASMNTKAKLFDLIRECDTPADAIAKIEGSEKSSD